MIEYKSVEQRIWDSAVGVLAESFVKSTYGTFVSQFRIPTTIRKAANEQLWVESGKQQDRFMSGDKPKESSVLGTAFGVISVIGLDYLIINYLKVSNSQQDYLPLALTAGAFALTNLASGIYETSKLIRDKRRLEKQVEQLTPKK